MLTFLTILHYLIQGFILVLIIQALLSWLPGAPESGLGRIISAITRPLLEPLNKIIPRIGMISFTVLIAVILLQLADIAVISLINRGF